MSSPESLLTAGAWAGLALVQVTLVSLLGLLAWLATRRRGPALRGAFLLASLAALLAVPALAVVAPVWLPLPQWLCPTPATVSPTVGPGEGAIVSLVVSPANQPVVAVALPQRPADSLLDMLDPAKQLGDKAAAKAEVFLIDETLPGTGEWRVAISEPQEPSPPATRSSPLATVAITLTVVWLLGTLVCLARALLAMALLYRRVRQSIPIRDPQWTNLLALLAESQGLGDVALRESVAIGSPLTLGLFRPVILLPASRRHWPVEQRALVLTHELAHVRRRDFLAGLVAELASCLCWFHPLVRWIAGRLRLEQEFAADACVASAADDATDYIRCLARLALGQSGRRSALAPALWRRRPEILRRIDMLRCNPNAQPPHLGRRAAWMVALLAAVACLAVAGVGPLQTAGGEPKTPAAAPESQARATADSHGDPLPAGALARLGTTRLRHSADVTFVAFGPDGKTLITAAQDNTIRVWDLSSGNEVRRFARPAAVAPKVPPKTDPKNTQPKIDDILMAMGGQGGRGGFNVALAPGAKTLAATGPGVIRLWELATGKELRTIEVPGRNLVGLLFSPDARTLVARTANGTLLLWATETGKLLHEIKPPERKTDGGVVLVFGGGGGGDPLGMAFTPDGKSLAAAGIDYKKEEVEHSIKFWDVASGKETRKIPAPKGVNVSAVAVAPDARVLAYCGGDHVSICEADTGKELHRIDVGVRSMLFSPDSKTLAIRQRNGRLRLWEVASGKERHQLTDAEPPPQFGGGLAFVFAGGFAAGPEARVLGLSPDGKRIASASGSTVRLWDTATGKEVTLLEGHSKPPSAIVMARDGKTVVSWSADRVVRRWEAGTGNLLGAFAAPTGTTLVAFSPDGRTVALANSDNTLRLHDTTTGKELRQIKGRTAGTSALGFSADGKLLAARGNNDSIRLYDVASGTELRELNPRPAAPAGGGGGTVIFIGGPARRANGTAPGVAFSPDGKLVVVPTGGGGGGGPGNTLVVFDTATGKELRKIVSPQAIASYAFSPDSRTLAAENTDRTITLWEVAGARQRARFGKPSEAPAPDGGGRMAINVEIDGIAGGFSEPAGPVGVTFSPDGRAIVVRGAGGSVRVWDVLAGKEISQFKGHTGRVDTIAMAANGKTLASGAHDTTILLWDAAGPMKELSRPQAVELKPADMEGLWRDLTGEDAGKALQSLLKLSDGSQQAAPFMGERLKPAVRVDPDKLSGWIADLESNTFTVRRKAIASLLKVGEQAIPALQKVLAGSPPLETRKRVEELLDQLTSGELTAAQLRTVRAVEALERMGTAEARQVLRTLADGAPGALPTREAQAALARMTTDR
jgi:WD40 repeat protein/beta-lactamase regulating signal transducer with metallopeptidase domain